MHVPTFYQSNYFYIHVYVLLILVSMYLFPPSSTPSSYYLYCTSLPCLLYTPDPIASDCDHSHPPITTASLHYTTTCLPSSNSRSDRIRSLPPFAI
ncbi:hypothetical protein CROQUDRAFT_664124 [Cronartium quercuum f. sp. fusiforme G11]|uniref:Uncharacterized protein n=1 Tax=Cronartium quercuum f. sp. fusiforme G11 TaxID=708437 RepID=A0A9P6N7S9_9BASI|nr:hypothetical protein CROQUDRAFT_664124 [Cronartium quercuum f. sp. fusiforme G11]